MFRENCQIVKNIKVAPGHFVLTLRSVRISKNAKPGQFVQILCADSFEPLLPRPFSFLSVDGDKFSILYQVVGKGTKVLAGKKAGESLWTLGPLGNGFSLKSKGELVFVGGGVGIPPLFHLAKTLLQNKKYKISPKNIHIFLGARNKSLLLCEKDFKKLGVDLKVATDDGSKGHKGLVTELLEKYLSQELVSDVRFKNFISTCGPTPMLKAVSKVAQKYEVPCEVSVEVPMACGFGACLGCAIKVKSDDSHRFAIACCEGPVFKGNELVWE